MNENNELDYVLTLIDKHRNNAYRKINEELVMLYYETGKYLSEKVSNESWGANAIERISKGIREKHPNLKGFDKRGLYRMIQFYETYKNNRIVSPLVLQISWSNNIIIFSKAGTMDEKEFYIRLCIKNNYSVRELNRQIASGYYERYMMSKYNALESNDKEIDEDDYPNTRLLDYYSLEFLDLPNNYSEKDLRRGLVKNLKDFILELGNDFSFIGEEYRIQVGNKDFYIDLLFYNRNYSCLVAFELKIGEFKPEYISKMNFYLEALDRQEKHCYENPSVGIILCSSKDETIVEYATARSVSKLVVSEYSTKLIDKEILKEKMVEIRKLLK